MFHWIFGARMTKENLSIQFAHSILNEIYKISLIETLKLFRMGFSFFSSSMNLARNEMYEVLVLRVFYWICVRCFYVIKRNSNAELSIIKTNMNRKLEINYPSDFRGIEWRYAGWNLYKSDTSTSSHRKYE